MLDTIILGLSSKCHALCNIHLNSRLFGDVDNENKYNSYADDLKKYIFKL